MNTDLRDILITRAVDGRARPEDWHTIETLARTEPAIWRELALAQRDERALSIAVTGTLRLAHLQASRSVQHGAALALRLRAEPGPRDRDR